MVCLQELSGFLLPREKPRVPAAEAVAGKTAATRGMRADTRILREVRQSECRGWDVKKRK